MTPWLACFSTSAVLCLSLAMPLTVHAEATALPWTSVDCAEITYRDKALAFSTPTREFISLNALMNSYYLLRERYPQKRNECAVIDPVQVDMHMERGDLHVRLTLPTGATSHLEVSSQGRVYWPDAGVTSAQRIPTRRTYTDISTQVAVHPLGCSAFVVQTGPRCATSKLAVVTAAHCAASTQMFEWLPQLTDADHFLGGNSKILFDFLENKKSQSFPITPSLENRCEDIRVEQVTSAPSHVRPLRLATRLPSAGETVYVYGYAQSKFPLRLKCVYQGIESEVDVFAGTTRLTERGVQHRLLCAYTGTGTESAGSLTAGMSGGPITLIDYDGKEAVFAVETKGQTSDGPLGDGARTQLRLFGKTLSVLNEDCENVVLPSFGQALAKAQNARSVKWQTENGLDANLRRRPITFEYQADTGCGREVER